MAAIGTALARQQLAANDLDRVLRGDESIAVTGFHIELQQRSVTCADQSVLKYMTQMMRKSSTIGDGGGYTYCFEFDFSTGRTYQLYGGIAQSQFSLSVPSAHPHDPGFPTHDVILDQPVPKRVNEIFAFLTAPWEEVGGLSLHVRDELPLQYTYRPHLHGGNPRGSRVKELTSLNE